MTVDDLMVNGKVPGGGTCIAAWCDASLELNRLMCATHDRRLSSATRCAVRDAWAPWQRGGSSLADLRAVQRRAAAEAVTEPVPGGAS